MSYFLAIIIVFLLFFAPVFLLLKLRRPVYNLSKDNVIRLFDQVLAGQCSETEWTVFTSVRMLHDPLIEKIRLLCVELEETQMKGKGINGHLFTERGEQQLKLYRSWLVEAQTQEDD